MPLYDYKCSTCGHVFEVMQKITEEPLKFCPECKGEIKRLISAPGVVFKGSGFHVTDYAKKPQTSSQSPVASSQGPESKGSKVQGPQGEKVQPPSAKEATEPKNSSKYPSPPKSE